MLCSSDSRLGQRHWLCELDLWALDRRHQLHGPLTGHHTPWIPRGDRRGAGVTANDLYWRLPRDGHRAREVPGVVSLRMTNDALGPVRHALAPLPRPNGGPVQLDTQVKSVLTSWPKATTRCESTPLVSGSLYFAVRRAVPSAGCGHRGDVGDEHLDTIRRRCGWRRGGRGRAAIADGGRRSVTTAASDSG